MTPFLTLKRRFKTPESVFAPERSLNTNRLVVGFLFFTVKTFENNDANLFLSKVLRKNCDDDEEKNLHESKAGFFGFFFSDVDKRLPSVGRKNLIFLLFYTRFVSPLQPQSDIVGLLLVLWHFGVILRVDVSAQADGQDHPQELSIKHRER